MQKENEDMINIQNQRSYRNIIKITMGYLDMPIGIVKFKNN